MPFVQRKLERSLNQTRGIFDTFVYRPENGDTIDDLLAPGYFKDSRFSEEISVLSAYLDNGLFVLSIDSNGNAMELSVGSPHFIAVSTTTVNVGSDAANPDVITGLSFTQGSNGFELRGSDGAVKNITGRDLGDCAGTISFQPNKTGGGVTVMALSSQISPDGINWTPNPFSLRLIEIPNNGETFKTAVSLAVNWPSEYYIRFVAYTQSGGSVAFESPTDTIAGEPVNGASVIWELREL